MCVSGRLFWPQATCQATCQASCKTQKRELAITGWTTILTSPPLFGNYVLVFTQLSLGGSKSGWQVPVWHAQSPFHPKSVKTQGQSEKGTCWVEEVFSPLLCPFVYLNSDWLVLKTSLQMWKLFSILGFLWPYKILRRFGSQMSEPHCSGDSHRWSKCRLAAGVSYPMLSHEAYYLWSLHRTHTHAVPHDPGCPLHKYLPCASSFGSQSING